MKSIRLSELQGLTEEEIKQRLVEFNSNPSSDKECIEHLDRQISVFEQRYEMSSKSMLELNGIRDTNEICEWRMLLELKNGVLKQGE